MVIDKATGALLLQQNISAQNRLKKVFEKLSTGKRINRASDDAALLSVARQLEKQVRGFRAVENNIAQGLNALNIADGATGSISNLLQRQRELALQANNGTLNQQQRDALNQEFQQITAEVDRTAQSANFNGQTVLDGQSALSDGTGNIQVDPGTDSANQVTLEAADLRAATLGIDGLDISNPGNISAAISGLDAATDQVNTVRTNQGAVSNRLQNAYNTAVTGEINTTAALSLVEDMDFAKGIADRSRESILQQSTTMSLRNFNEIARNNLLSLLQ